MQSITAVVLGATGLIGEQLVKELLRDDAFDKVRILVRRPVELTHKKLEVYVVNFGDPVDFGAKLGNGYCIFCCVGTTQKQVNGDNEAYRKVDYDIAVNAAQLGKAAGFRKYLLVSSAGADADAKNFYLKLKGEVEEAIGRQQFESFHVFRPGILLGKRKEFRLGELLGKGILNALSFAFVGPLKKYRAIRASNVAKAMLHASKLEVKGMVLHYYKEMMNVS